MEIAKNRELFFWITAFSAVSAGGMLSKYVKTKRSGLLAPLLPMGFVVSYFADLAYGNKSNRIKAEAEMIINHEEHLVHWPCGLPTVSEIDQARIKNEEEIFLHPHQQ